MSVLKNIYVNYKNNSNRIFDINYVFDKGVVTYLSENQEIKVIANNKSNNRFGELNSLPIYSRIKIINRKGYKKIFQGISISIAGEENRLLLPITPEGALELSYALKVPFEEDCFEEMELLH